VHPVTADMTFFHAMAAEKRQKARRSFSSILTIKIAVKVGKFFYIKM